MTCTVSSELSFLGGPRQEFGLAKMKNPKFLDQIFSRMVGVFNVDTFDTGFNVRGYEVVRFSNDESV